MTRLFLLQGSHVVRGRKEAVDGGDGLRGLGTCIGASKRGTLRKGGTIWLVTSVILAEACR
jgi:hypothetical protein